MSTSSSSASSLSISSCGHTSPPVLGLQLATAALVLLYSPGELGVATHEPLLRLL